MSKHGLMFYSTHNKSFRIRIVCYQSQQIRYRLVELLCHRMNPMCWMTDPSVLGVISPVKEICVGSRFKSVGAISMSSTSRQ